MTTHSCSAVRGAAGVCVAAAWRGRVSLQGTWGSSCAGHAATGPMVTAATVDASAVRSVGLYILSPACPGRGACRPPSRPPRRRSCGPARPRPRCCFPFAVPWWLCPAGGPVAAPPGSAPAGGWVWSAAGSSARPGAPGACGTGSVGGAPGPPGGGRGVGAGTSGPVRWTGCGVLVTVPPHLPVVRLQRGVATPVGPGGLSCSQAGCGSAGRAPAVAPAPGPASRWSAVP